MKLGIDKIMSELQTLKSDLTKTRLVYSDAQLSNLSDGQIVVRVERFAFTANNITYGVAGEDLGYWKFFPPLDNPEDEWGCIPMWGFAEISQSNNEALRVGERIFGYFPASHSLILSPIKISAKNFVDGETHRRELPATYNNYVRLGGEPNYNRDLDNARALLWPLHITAFLLCDALQEDSYSGASQVVITSASSKTSIGLAQGLAEKKQSPKIVGLTSTSNCDFVGSLGCYDSIISYDELDSVDSSLKSLMVDMAGNPVILGAVHRMLADNMLKCLTVGMTHWNSSTSANDPLGKAILRDRTEFFFAPTHLQKLIVDWGLDGYNEKVNDFMHARASQSKNWMQVKEIFGLESFLDTYKEVVSGNIDPSKGIIVTVDSG